MYENARKIPYRSGARPFALKVMQRLNDKCKEGKQLRISAILYMELLAESTTYKFAKCLQEAFWHYTGSDR